MLDRSSIMARLAVIRDEIDGLIEMSDKEIVEAFQIASTMHEIAERVAMETGVAVQQMRGRNRRKEINKARKIAMYRMYATGRFSSADIGQFFGGRDHTTVLHAIKSLER